MFNRQSAHYLTIRKQYSPILYLRQGQVNPALGVLTPVQCPLFWMISTDIIVVPKTRRCQVNIVTIAPRTPR